MTVGAAKRDEPNKEQHREVRTKRNVEEQLIRQAGFLSLTTKKQAKPIYNSIPPVNSGHSLVTLHSSQVIHCFTAHTEFTRAGLNRALAVEDTPASRAVRHSLAAGVM